MTTIMGVAKLAKVSKTSVSRYLNGQNVGHMSEETKERIIAAIKELDYQPNSIARSLKQKSTKVIGLVVNDMSNLFFLEIIRGIEMELKNSGYNLLVCNSDTNVEMELQCLKMLEKRQIDGVILIGMNMPVSHIEKIRTEFPIVLMERDPGKTNLDSVQIDNKVGAYEAVKHLIERGHQRIAHITGPFISTMAMERKESYEECLKDYGIEVWPQFIVSGNYKLESGYAGMQALMALREKPTAVFCANDYMAMGALRFLMEHNYKVPQDVALVGYDDIMVSKMVTPSLTTVRQPVWELAGVATRLLLERIKEKGQKEHKGQKVIMQSELVIRASS